MLCVCALCVGAIATGVRRHCGSNFNWSGSLPEAIARGVGSAGGISCRMHERHGGDDNSREPLLPLPFNTCVSLLLAASSFSSFSSTRSSGATSTDSLGAAWAIGSTPGAASSALAARAAFSAYLLVLRAFLSTSAFFSASLAAQGFGRRCEDCKIAEGSGFTEFTDDILLKQKLSAAAVAGELARKQRKAFSCSAPPARMQAYLRTKVECSSYFAFVLIVHNGPKRSLRQEI